MARHMITERMKPDEPSSAPAVMSSLLSSTKPIATAESPAYEFNSEMTVGMSAPPMGRINSTPNVNDKAMMIGKSHCQVGFSTNTTAQATAMPSKERFSTF